MDKTKIKNFAINARKRLRTDVKQTLANYGINNSGINDELDISTPEVKFYTTEQFPLTGHQIVWRQQIADHLKQSQDEWIDTLDEFIEEVAYTWFNRIIAIRFMEVNDYLPSRTRVLSSEEGRVEPDIISHVWEIEDDLGGYSDDERELIGEALNTQLPAKMDEMYAMLFIKQSDALSAILPGLFEKTNDYLKLLFTPNYNSGVIKDLLNDIPEAYFDVEQEGQVEIIGWLYQYYNTEPKDRAFKKSNYSTNDIPAVTQLFTPSWIVKYMVENSLGRYWIDILHARGDERSEKEIADEFGWNYYMPSAPENDGKFNNQVNKDITEIKFIDPAMGSGHILVYAFHVFIQLYENEGYSRREAVDQILENNLYGLDIDTRAYQLSYFAVNMLGRQYNRRFFREQHQLNLVDVPSSKYSVNDYAYLVSNSNVTDPAKALADIDTLIQLFANGNDLGSIIKIPVDLNLKQLESIATDVEPSLGEMTFDDIEAENCREELLAMVKVAKLLDQKYEIAVSNPPYMGSRKMPAILKEYLAKKYPKSKKDLCTVFIEKLLDIIDSTGYLGMITQHSWMFISSYESLRAKLQHTTIINLAHLGTHAFEEIGGEVVQSTTFIIQNKVSDNYMSTFERLVEYDSQDAKEKEYLRIASNKDSHDLYHNTQSNFKKIPGSPVAYWASDSLIHDFEVGTPLSKLVDAKQGLATADNNRFLRQWFEVAYNKISFNSHSIAESVESHKKWFPYNKGGAYRKWYGNYDYVVNWENDGFDIKHFTFSNGKQRSVVRNPSYYFKPAITWSDVNGGNFSLRYRKPGSIHDVKGMSAFSSINNIKKYMGVLNSKLGNYIFNILNPTISLQIGNFQNFPYLENDNIPFNTIDNNIYFSKKDWDSFETSWDFKKHPFLSYIANYNRNETLEEAYNEWEQEAFDRFSQLKANEEELNRIFIDLYGLQDELTPEESDDDVTVRKADRERDIKSFLSYFIGCVFGRYSLDVDGLAYAGGKWDDSKYKTFQPNHDNLILLTDRDYFGDSRDIINRLREFLVVTFGEEHLAENMHFIAETLDSKKVEKRVADDDIIRDYFLTSFFKDHDKIYQKRPIYWEFNSGRNDGFKALMYLHRYDKHELSIVRNYLHQVQAAYDNMLKVSEQSINHAASVREKHQYQKNVAKLKRQLDELHKYDGDLHHQSLNEIELDLDDGVLINHAKLQGNKKLLSKI